MDFDNFVQDEFGNWHRDGIPWWSAPVPRRFHRCKAQTYGSPSYSLDRIYRCACGAYKVNMSNWIDKNRSRRKK